MAGRSDMERQERTCHLWIHVFDPGVKVNATVIQLKNRFQPDFFWWRFTFCQTKAWKDVWRWMEQPYSKVTLLMLSPFLSDEWKWNTPSASVWTSLCLWLDYQPGKADKFPATPQSKPSLHHITWVYIICLIENLFDYDLLCFEESFCVKIWF